jgi:hypothetical protein
VASEGGRACALEGDSSACGALTGAHCLFGDEATQEAWHCKTSSKDGMNRNFWLIVQV